MTTATTAAPTSTEAGRVLALTATEVRLVLRNRTVAVSAIVVPLGLGLFWSFTFGTGGDPASFAVVLALQLAVVLSMGIYVTATLTLVARRHARVLKRMRTSGMSDRGLLLATVAPSVVLGLAQLVVFAVINAATGAPLPVDPVPLVLAVLGGLALVVTAALATTIVTQSPERAQITTLPLTFVLLGAAIVLAIAPLDGWWQALVAVPGAAIGQLAQLTMTGATWAPGALGLPAAVPALVALVVWPVVFGVLAMRRFRWDPRH
jgi:ABC-2 type transport system permease protein